jgi:CO/xanthine dehydrogenase Mo-binding subunit
MKKRGKGIACMIYPVGTTSHANPSAAVVVVNQDGTATVLSGAADVGQGSTTVLAQIAAEELGIPYDSVAMVTSDTARTPYDHGTNASRVTYVTGNAIQRAAANAKRVLLEIAAEVLQTSVEGLDAGGGFVYMKGLPEKRIPIGTIAERAFTARGELPVGSASYNPVTTDLDSETGQGKPFATYVFATQIAEVEVDIETGEVEVLRIVAAHDCGRAINPMLVEGQVLGGICMGVGYALMEELVLEDGEVKNPNFVDYVVPTALDMPHVDVSLIEEPDPTGPYGAKGIGESTMIPTAPAIINAIHDAIGVRIRDLPATPQKILDALKAKEAKRSA